MDLERLLGSEAESLVAHASHGISADQLVLPGPDFVERVLIDSDRPTVVSRNLQLLFDSARRFRAGEDCLYRGLDERGRVISVLPVRVVRDDADLVALWLPLGVRTVKPELVSHTPGTPRRWVDGNWYLAESTWRWAELLILARPDEPWATWVRWSAERKFQGWAVNMQSEPTRTYLGFDIWDHQLDIIVSPDRTWHWKDQDELDLSVELGRMTSEKAAKVRTDARLAVERIEGNGFPYADGIQRWTPDPGWTLPDLHPAWADLSMYPPTGVRK